MRIVAGIDHPVEKRARAGPNIDIVPITTAAAVVGTAINLQAFQRDRPSKRDQQEGAAAVSLGVKDAGGSWIARTGVGLGVAKRVSGDVVDGVFRPVVRSSRGEVEVRLLA